MQYFRSLDYSLRSLQSKYMVVATSGEQALTQDFQEILLKYMHTFSVKCPNIV